MFTVYGRKINITRVHVPSIISTEIVVYTYTFTLLSALVFYYKV